MKRAKKSHTLVSILTLGYTIWKQKAAIVAARKIVALGFCLLINACATHNVRQFDRIDGTQKTITVPAGGGGLIGAIKDALRANGWKMAVDRGPRVTEGQLGAETSLQQYDTFNTRYRLLIRSRQFDICLNLDAALVYDISLIDNLNGQELLTMSGRGCEADIAKRFVEALAGRSS